ncbi:hypothetical protein AXF42_Ash016688 [Apostasia shenzhenica]|uniref:Myb-like domain-containing protein n=1 Tax=Apostasia shenzhenica TaxID=1088818 RepID=A0A2I0AQ13_9ASPA|nr:hypothetical protein AXF42_Ash016688 [Apostasia shenzhenica]
MKKSSSVLPPRALTFIAIACAVPQPRNPPTRSLVRLRAGSARCSTYAAGSCDWTGETQMKPSRLTPMEATERRQRGPRRSQRVAFLTADKMIEIPKANVEVNHVKPVEADCRVANSQIRRFSVRLASITAKAGKNLMPEVTVKSSPMKTQRRDHRAVTSLIKRPLTQAALSVAETNEGATSKVIARGKKMQDGKQSERLKDFAKTMKMEEEIQGFNVYWDVSDLERIREDGSVEDGEVGKRRKLENQIETGFEIIENTECCGSATWTKEQEEALEKAYILAKPSPHFWKKVSKMVPGKSAQECFDRIHSGLPTPVSRHPRPRTSRKILSPIGNLNLSTSSSHQVPEPNAGKPRSKMKKLAVQKTLRHLLRNHSLAHQSEESDHFYLFESSPVKLAAYQLKSQSPESCLNRSDSPVPPRSENPSARSRICSRLRLLDSPIGPSPEVLKQIKNRDLHDKYVDQLHQREQRRLMVAKRSNHAAMDKVDIKLLVTSVLCLPVTKLSDINLNKLTIFERAYNKML